MTLIDFNRALAAPYQDTSVHRFYEAYVQHLDQAPKLHTFREWLSFGAKFAQIAVGGSVYSLLILSSLNFRWDIAKVHSRVLYDVAAMLRHPKIAESGKLHFIIYLC